MSKHLKSSNSLFILIVAGSALLLIIRVKAKWSTIASKSTLFNKWAKLPIFIAKPHISNSVKEYFIAVSGKLLLPYAISLGCPFEFDTKHFH